MHAPPWWLLIWISVFLIGCESAEESEPNCYKKQEIKKVPLELSNEGWNNVGSGFIGIFTPAKFGDSHWEKVGEILGGNKGAIAKLVLSFGGLIFLAVFGILLLIAFSAAPCVFCCFNAKRKKKKKSQPKFNPILNFVGIGCSVTALLFLFLALLFFIFSVESLVSGFKHAETPILGIPDTLNSMVARITDAALCGSEQIMDTIAKAPAKIKDKVLDAFLGVESLKEVTKIDFAKNKRDYDAIQTLVGNLQTLIGTTSMTTARTALKTAVDAMYTAMTNSNFGTKINAAEEAVAKIKDREKAKKSINDLLTKPMEKIENFPNIISGKMKNLTGVLAKLTDKLKKPMSGIKPMLKTVTGYVRFMRFSYFILLPLVVLMVAAGFTVFNGVKLVKKKKVKPQDARCSPILLPLNIAFGLAFLPILVAIVFMFASGTASVTCGTIFDPSMEILTRMFTMMFPNQGGGAAEQTEQATPARDANGDDSSRKKRQANVEEKEEEHAKFEPHKMLEKCKSKDKQTGKSTSLMAAMEMDKQMNKTELLGEMDEYMEKIGEIAFPLPKASTWKDMTDALSNIGTATDAVKLAVLTAADGTDFAEINKKVKEIDDSFKAFQTSPDLVMIGKLNNADMEQKIKKNLGGLLNTILKDIGNEAEKALKDIMSVVDCDVIFIIFNGVGDAVCKQIAGGVHGTYAAAGLGVMCYFSAAVGGILVWCSLSAGKGQDSSTPSDDPKGSDKKDKKGKKKKGKGKKGDKEESASTDNKQPLLSAPDAAAAPAAADAADAAAGQAPPPAVPTDPDVNNNTNPSLLPSTKLGLPDDGAGAAPGAPAS